MYIVSWYVMGDYYVNCFFKHDEAIKRLEQINSLPTSYGCDLTIRIPKGAIA